MSSNDADLPHLLFVYGTLKPEETRCHLLYDKKEGEVEYVGRAITASKYPLIVYTEWNFPFMMDIPGDGHHVEGAVFKIDDKRLAWCDATEMVPHIYSRDKITVKLLPTAEGSVGESLPSDAGKPLECWCYLFRKYRESHLSAQRYPSYSHTITPYLWSGFFFPDVKEVMRLIDISED